MTNPYKPIACSLHDEYEIAIMQKKHLTTTWLDDSGFSHSDKVLPKDILVKDGEEFLIADTRDNKALKIRLDKITILD
jgi:transcriptional antiterminator Rof (Rho-off)